MTRTEELQEALGSVEAELRGIFRRLKRRTAERAAEVHPELLPSSYAVLRCLWENGPARGSLLAAEFGIDKAAMSRHLQHLADLGLVDRTTDPADRRATLVAVAEAAQELLTQDDDHRRKLWEDRFADWDVAEVRTFARLLARVDQHA